MVVCSRCQYWEVGSTPDRRECDICRLLHNIVQLCIGGTINLEQEHFVAEQLRFFFAGLSYLAERHPNLYPGPGHVNNWITQRPLSLVPPSGVTGAAPLVTPAPTVELPSSSPPVRLLPRQVELASHPVGNSSQTFDRLYGPFQAWTPSLRPRSPSVVRAVASQPSRPAATPPRGSPSPVRESTSQPSRKSRSPIVETAKVRRSRRNLSPRYRRPLPDDPEVSSHSSDSDLTWWSSESCEELAPDDHPIPKRDKRFGKAIRARELAEFGQKPLTRYSEGARERSPSKVHKKKKANKGKKKRERQQAIRDGTFVPKSASYHHGEESKGKGWSDRTHPSSGGKGFPR